jgi:hypothetical protein
MLAMVEVAACIFFSAMHVQLPLMLTGLAVVLSSVSFVL